MDSAKRIKKEERKIAMIITRPKTVLDEDGYEVVVSDWVKKTYSFMDSRKKPTDTTYYKLYEGGDGVTLAFRAAIEVEVTTGEPILPNGCVPVTDEERKKLDSMYAQRNRMLVQLDERERSESNE